MLALTGLLGLGAIISITLLVPSVFLLPVRKWRTATRRIVKYSALTLILLIVALAIVAPRVPDAPKPTAEKGATPTKEPDSAAVAGKPGRAKICLIGDDFKFDTYKEITIPATAIFSSSLNAHAKIPGDPTQRSDEKPTLDSAGGNFVTDSPVILTKTNRCAETEVRMYVGRGSNAGQALVADNRIFDLDGIIDYPIPATKPPVEFGKLADDMSVSAVLTGDVTESLRAPAELNDDAAAARCLRGATDVARYMGAKVGEQTRLLVEIEQTGAGYVSFGCAKPPSDPPDLYVSWEKRARPPAATAQFVGEAGEYLIGARADELRQELSACVEAALRPESHEISSREFRGAKIECQAFARDGGGGSVTIYRRFGAYPMHTSSQLLAPKG